MPTRNSGLAAAGGKISAPRTVNQSFGKSSSAHNAYSELVLDPCYADLTGLPDAYVGATVPYRAKCETICTSNAAGDAGAICNTNLSAAVYNSPTFVANAVTTWGTAVACDKAATIAAEFSTMRILGACVKVSWIGPAQTCAGRVVLYRTEQTATSSLYSSPSTWMADPVNARVYPASSLLDTPVEVRLWPFDGPVFQTYANSNQHYLYQPCLAVGVLGAPASTACLAIDYTLIIEYVPLTTALSLNIASMTPSNPFDLAAGHNAGSVAFPDAGAKALRRKMVDDTFSQMGMILGITNPNLGNLVASLPNTVRTVRRAVKTNKKNKKKKQK